MSMPGTRNENPNASALIKGFLAIAAVAAVGVWFSMGSEENPAPGIADEPLPAGSAFTEALPSIDPSGSENLTDNLARTIMEGMLVNNPDGPWVDGEEFVLTVPEADIYMERFLEKPGTYAAGISNEIQILPNTLKPDNVRTLSRATREQKEEYLSQVLTILRGEVPEEQIRGLISGPASPEALSALETTFSASLKRLDELAVPRDLVDFHLAARESVLRTKFLLGLPSESDDPLKIMLAAEQNSVAATRAMTELAAEAAKIPDLLGQTPASERFSLGIPVAHALALPLFVPVTDIPNTTGTWTTLGKMIVDWAKDYFKEKLKDLVVNRLTRAMVGWVKGEGLSAGQPRFVTNWQRFMDDVVNEAGGSVIESVAPELCQSFGPLVRVAVEPIGARGPRFRTSCTLDRVVSNIQDFYDDFENGGWLAYGAAYQERNNYFGSLLAVNEEVMSAISKAKEAKRDETVAAGGYLGSVVCVKWGWKEAPGTTTSNGLPVLPRGNFECLERKTTTPGSTVGSVVNQALLAPLHRIVNADRLTELMNALLDFEITKLFNSFKNQWGDKGLLGVEVGNVTPGNPLKNCEGLSGDAYALCVDEMRKACLTLPPELQQECLDYIVEESACNLGEKEMDSPNASGADPSGTEGWWCDNDSVMSSLPEPATVRFRCTSDGFAGITRNMQNCNVREDQGTLGWTFDEAGTPTDLDGNPVTFEVKLTCPDETYVDLPAGDWNVVAWTRNPSNAAIACAVGEGGILGGSCIGNDASSPPPIADDLSNVIWDDTDVSGWEETGTLSSVTVRGEEYCLDYDKTNTWPAVAPFPEWDAVIVGNPWIFAYRGGAWHGATTEWFGEGRTCKGTDTLNPSSNSIDR